MITEMTEEQFMNLKNVVIVFEKLKLPTMDKEELVEVITSLYLVLKGVIQILEREVSYDN